jgi:hypothetical protein
MLILSALGEFSFRSATPCEKAFKHVASASALSARLLAERNQTDVGKWKYERSYDSADFTLIGIQDVRKDDGMTSSIEA